MKIKIGVFTDKEWQFNMYVQMFRGLLPDAKIWLSNDEARIETDTHLIKIFGYATTGIRGMKYDAVINLIDNEEFRHMCLIPALNCSRYIKRGWESAD
jgi:hypothetical protein